MRTMGRLLLLGLVCAQLFVGAESAAAGGGVVAHHLKAQVRDETISAARQLCAERPGIQVSVQVSGFYLWSIVLNGPQLQGAIFPTAEVPINAAGRGPWIQLRGLAVGVQIKTRTASVPNSENWLRMRGTLLCGPHGASLLKVRSWNAIAPLSTPSLNAVRGTMTPRAATALCARMPGSEYRVHIVGSFTKALSLTVNQGSIGRLAVVSSAARPPSALPEHTPLVAFGLLSCVQRSPVFEVYSWKKPPLLNT